MITDLEVTRIFSQYGGEPEVTERIRWAAELDIAVDEPIESHEVMEAEPSD